MTAPKKDHAKTAGDRVKTRREKLGLSQVELAKRLKWGEHGSSRLGNYEQGSRMIGVPEACVLADELNVHPAYLMGLVDEIDSVFLLFPAKARRGLVESIVDSMTELNRPEQPPEPPPQGKIAGIRGATKRSARDTTRPTTIERAVSRPRAPLSKRKK